MQADSAYFNGKSFNEVHQLSLERVASVTLAY